VEKEGAEKVPYSVDAWLTLGSLQLALGDAGAAATVDSALTSDRTYAWVHDLAARRLLNIDAPEATVNALRYALIADSISPVADPRIKRTLALAQLKSNDAPGALRSAESALQLDGQDGLTAAVAAFAAAKTGALDRAKSYYQSAMTAFSALPANELYLPTMHHGILSIATTSEWKKVLDSAQGLIQVGAKG